MDKLEGHWAKRTILEPDTGNAYNKYFYKRKPADRVVVDTPKANVLAGYTLIEKDLRSALIWMRHIKELLSGDPNFTDPKGHIKATYDRDRFNIVKGLFVASLTFYGKSFATCEGRRVKLEKNNLYEEFHEEHDNAMEFRHNFAAHSGAKQLERASVVLAIDKKRRELPYFVRELIQPDTLSTHDLDDFIKLFEHARTFTENKIRTLAEKVYKEDVLAKGPEYWYAKT